MARQYSDPWLQKAKWLTQALIISGTLNVGLLSTFIYFALSDKEKPLAQKSSLNDLSEKANLRQLLENYRTLTFQDLFLRLANNDHVEAGYTRRDIALACLVHDHYFNLEGALGGITLQKREITFDGNTLTVFPGLADYQYQAILQYAKTEKWPLTAEGLHQKISSSKPPHDPTLLEAFYLTPQFHFLSLLFSKTGINLKKEYTAILLAQSRFSTLSETTNHLRQNGEFTPEERRHFLLQLVSEDSKLAAKILTEVDQEYCLKNLDNEKILLICTLLGEKANSSFLKQLLQSPRPDTVWQTAAAILYEQAAEDVPENFTLENAKRRFIELKSSPPPPTVARKKNVKTYTVVSGDSLWKIAKAHNTTIQALRDANHLKTDQLKIGQTLTIP